MRHRSVRVQVHLSCLEAFEQRVAARPADQDPAGGTCPSHQPERTQDGDIQEAIGSPCVRQQPDAALQFADVADDDPPGSAGQFPV